MNEETVRQTAAMYSLVAEMKSIEADIEGMKIANVERKSKGDALAYHSSAFFKASSDLLTIAIRLRNEI